MAARRKKSPEDLRDGFFVEKNDGFMLLPRFNLNDSI